MRRGWRLLALWGATLLLVVPSMQAGAAPNPPPVVLAAAWISAPVSAGQPEVLQVTTFDPTEVIKEVVIEWGDGVISFATLRCSRGPATTRVGHQYDAAGIYVVSVVARSADRCSAQPQQESAPFLVPTRAG
jgi:hypothetical protein